MASPAKRRRLSPSKPQAGRSSSGGGSSPASSAQPSVLSFFATAAAAVAAPASGSSSTATAESLRKDIGTGVQGTKASAHHSASASAVGASRAAAGKLSPVAAPSTQSRTGTMSMHNSADVSSRSTSPAKKEAAVPCPVCGRVFPYRQIAAHASSCLDFQSSDLAEHAGSSSLASPERVIPQQERTTQSESSNSSASQVPPAPAPTLLQNSNAVSANGPAPDDDRDAPGTSSNVFTHLMKSHGALKQWASADMAEAKNQAAKGKSHASSPRSVPFYKIVTGTPISVDAFRFGKIDGCTAYFLTHFHGDHYGGLTPNWRWGYIYGSRTTCELVKSHLGVNPKWVRELPMEEKVLIDDTGGVSVTLLDANHCPGSCLFLFEGPQTVDILRPGQGRFYGKKHFRALHCGDFRASPRHTNHPRVLGLGPSMGDDDVEAPLLDKKNLTSSAQSLFAKPESPAKLSSNASAQASTSKAKLNIQKIDTVYLDTTYLNPRYCFPAQEEVVQACADLVLNEAARLHAYVQKSENQQDGQASLKREGDAGVGSSTLASWLSGFGAIKKEGAIFNADASLVKGVAASDVASGSDSPVAPHGIPVKREIDDELELGEEKLFNDDPLEDMAPVDDVLGADGEYDSIKQEGDDPFESEPTNNANNAEVKVKTDSKPFLSWLPLKADNPNGKRRNRLLVLVGTYTIGKEKIVKACARALQTRIFCPSPRKYDVYDKLEDPELHALLTRDPADADVFVTNLSAINGQGLHDLVAELRTQGHDIKRAIAFRPTGWTYKPPAGIDTTAPDLRRLIAWNQSRQFGPDRLFPTRDSTREYQIYGVPYSEHSSFFELTAFALSLDYDRIIATVNVGNPTSRAKMEKWFERWMIEKRRRQKAGEPSRLPSRTLDYW